jgi:hypothetical protein
MAKSRPRQSARQKPAGDKRNSRATVSGPAQPNASTSSTDDLAAKVTGTQELAASMAFNAHKPPEYDPDAATARWTRALDCSCHCVNQRGDNHG